MVGQAAILNRYACPECGGNLVRSDDRATCPGGHSFEVARDVLILETVESAQADFFSHAWHDRRSRSLAPPARRRLAPFADQLSGAILELGAGDGSLARSRPDLDMMSMDLVIDGIGDLGARASVGSIVQLPFKSRAFDVVLAFEVLEHLTPSERARAIAEIGRVTRARGTLIASVPTWPPAFMERVIRSLRSRTWASPNNLHRWDRPHLRRFRRGELESELRGFEIIRVHYWARSFTSFATYLLNPVLRRLFQVELDTHLLDRLIPFDAGSNQVILARRTDPTG